MVKTNSAQNIVTKMSARKLLSIFIAALPPLVLMSFASKYTVNLPFADEWYFVPLFEKMFNHTLTFNNLWAQHNEHRFLTTRLITLLNVRLTGWDLRYEVYLNVVLGIIIFLSIVTLLKKWPQNFRRFSVYWIFPSISILIFSLTQSENWLWGIQMNIFLNLLFISLGFINLTSILRWKSVFFAALFGFSATYSNSSGLLFWPISLIIIYLNPNISKKFKRKILLSWFATTIIVFISYFYDWHSPQYGIKAIGWSFMSLLQFAQLFLSLSGSALEIFSSKTAASLGFLGISTYSYLLVQLIKRGLLKSQIFLVQLALTFFAIFNLFIVSASRLKFGLTQDQLTTRYGLTSIFFWVSIIVLIFLYANLRAKEAKQRSKLAPDTITVCFITIAIITTLATKSSLQGMQLGIERQTFLRSIQTRVVSSESSNETLLALVEVYPRQSIGSLNNVVNSAGLINAISILSKHNLSIFR